MTEIDSPKKEKQGGLISQSTLFHLLFLISWKILHMSILDCLMAHLLVCVSNCSSTCLFHLKVSGARVEKTWCHNMARNEWGSSMCFFRNETPFLPLFSRQTHPVAWGLVPCFQCVGCRPGHVRAWQLNQSHAVLWWTLI